ncbi:ATP-dependent helicase [Rubrivirga sp. S365]|uniref:ATP-dependent helicase n=1 Tax=Rubrivirga sp. S365 TaxID=3076080 RepID=UPI0028CA7048|nr:ATP-dependent helicase [Rubrivirga sp. S365]MDT7857045.1 ATP-dependent helicase [Rubrivirga sp. S365]
MARRFVLQPRAPAPPAALQIDYAEALDPQQHAAATAPGGATLIVAGAGTGKTRTLTYRVAYLVETGVKPEQIALLTFTRRAAREMIERAGALLDGRCERVRGGTFHAFCLETLRVHAEAIGYPRRFGVLDAADAADVVDLARTRLGLHTLPTRFPKKRTLLAMFSAATNRGLALDDVLTEDYPQYAGHLDLLLDLQRAYAETKRQTGVVDYDDLLALTLRLLTESDDARRAVAGRCRHVLVDEYQDVNALQADLVEQLQSAHGNLTAVGDDAQSIYGFRGADVGHILDFGKRYNGARVLKLEHNYRSTQPILDLANHVLAGAREKYDKRLFTDREGGDRPALVQAPDDDWESRFVAQVVLDKREGGVGLHRQAVLFRSGWCSYALEAELTRRGVPFVKVGGLKLAEAAHVKDVVAHLRVAENPADAVAWNRVLRLVEGVGPQTAARLLDWIAAAADAGGPQTGEAAVHALRSADEVVPSPAVARAVGRLVEALTPLRDGSAPRPGGDALAPEAQVERVLAYYRPVFERVYADDWPRREADLDAVAALAAQHRSRTALLESLALDPLDWSQEAAEGALKDEAPLVLSTIHSAKGLEFDTVFLLHALDGVLPSQYAVRDQDGEDEERRLLYVALTRAETELYCSYPLAQYRRGTGQFLTEPSRFLSGVPEALLEPWSLVEDAAPPEAADAPALPESPPPALPGRGG